VGKETLLRGVEVGGVAVDPCARVLGLEAEQVAVRAESSVSYVRKRSAVPPSVPLVSSSTGLYVSGST
jgi:hypothetical protein